MKDQYFGDVNDYRKYGFLRSLLQVSNLPLGVCWLLTPNDARKDGEQRNYLGTKNTERWRKYDEQLYDLLSHTRDMKRDERKVCLAKEWNILPEAAYFEDYFDCTLSNREAYFTQALEEMANRPVLFFDPDNGIEVPSVPRVKWRSPKHIYWDEIKKAFRKHSLILYQHFPRKERSSFIEETACQIKSCVAAPRVDAFRTSHVVFFLVSQQKHASRFYGLHDHIARRWNGQIEGVSEAF